MTARLERLDQWLEDNKKAMRALEADFDNNENWTTEQCEFYDKYFDTIQEYVALGGK